MYTEPEQALLDAFKALEIEPTSNQTEIRRAYRNACLKYHPDKFDKQNQFQANEAEIKKILASINTSLAQKINTSNQSLQKATDAELNDLVTKYQANSTTITNHSTQKNELITIVQSFIDARSDKHLNRDEQTQIEIKLYAELISNLKNPDMNAKSVAQIYNSWNCENSMAEVMNKNASQPIQERNRDKARSMVGLFQREQVARPSLKAELEHCNSKLAAFTAAVTPKR